MPFVFPSPLRVLAAIVYAAITFLAGFWLFESFQFYARATSVSLLSMFLLQTRRARRRWRPARRWPRGAIPQPRR